MADYTPGTWVDESGTGNGTVFTAARMNALETGLQDASEHNATGSDISQRPAADAAHKNWIWRDKQYGVAYYCDGASWVPLNAPRNTAASAAARALTAASNSTPTTIPATAAVGYRFTAAASGEALVVQSYFERDSDIQGNLKAHIYADNAGALGARLTSSLGVGIDGMAKNVGAPPVGQNRLWTVLTFHLKLGVQLAQGTNYWVILENSATGNAYVSVGGPAGPGGSDGFSATNLSDSATYTYAVRSSPLAAVYVGSAAVAVLGDPNGAVEALRVDGASAPAAWADANGIYGADYWHTVGSPGEPAFTNGWVNYPIASAVNRPAMAFKRTLDNFVEFRGYLDALNATAVQVFTLPVGWRPRVDGGWAIVTWSAGWVAGRTVLSAADGTFRVLGAADSSPGGRRDVPIFGRVALD